MLCTITLLQSGAMVIPVTSLGGIAVLLELIACNVLRNKSVFVGRVRQKMEIGTVVEAEVVGVVPVFELCSLLLVVLAGLSVRSRTVTTAVVLCDTTVRDSEDMLDCDKTGIRECMLNQ